MNRRKRLAISGLIIAAASMSCLAMTAYADSREEQEMEALKTAFIGAEETLLDMAEYSAPSAEILGTTAGMSEQELADNIADYTARVKAKTIDRNKINRIHRLWKAKNEMVRYISASFG